MKRLRIYVDTSVIGGCFDLEFRTWSSGLIEDFRTRRFHLVLSDVTAAEMELAPAQVRGLYTELIPLAEILPVTEEVLNLLEKYETHGVGSILGFETICFILHWLLLPRLTFWSVGTFNTL